MKSADDALAKALDVIYRKIDRTCDAELARQRSMAQIRRSIAQRWRRDRNPLEKAK